MYKSIIWDWNGTLLDDLDAIVEATVPIAQSQNIHIDKDIYRQYFKMPIKEMYLDMGFNFETESFENLATKFMVLYSKIPKKLSTNAPEYLTRLKESGTENFICSAMDIRSIEQVIDQHNISNLFKGIYGAENHLANDKIHTALNLLKNENINPTETLVIGDSFHDYEIANAIGCEAVLVAQGADSREKLEKTGCRIFENFSDLSAILFSNK